TFLGRHWEASPYVSDSFPYAGSMGETAGQTVPKTSLTPVAASAATSLAPASQLPLKALIRELDPTDELDLEIQLSTSFQQIQGLHPTLARNELELWIEKIKASGSSLPTSIGMMNQDASAAIRWFERGAREGCRDGAYFAAEHHFLSNQARMAVPFLNQGVDEFADPRAQYLLGIFFLHGHGGLTQDYLQARTLLELAIDAGNTNAYQELAMMLEKGLGGKIDLRAATNNYRLGAQAGHRYCMARYANALQNGIASMWRNPAVTEHWAHLAKKAPKSELQTRVRKLRPHLYR
ncbi:MAG: hypothetical protein AAGH89_02525, partial [Verrucomicrobiota bacterium]